MEKSCREKVENKQLKPDNEPHVVLNIQYFIDIHLCEKVTRMT